jgi:hypothetical protein
MFLAIGRSPSRGYASCSDSIHAKSLNAMGASPAHSLPASSDGETNVTGEAAVPPRRGAVMWAMPARAPGASQAAPPNRSAEAAPPNRSAEAAPQAQVDHAARLLGFLATVLSHNRFVEAATALASELAAALHCDRVTLGCVEGKSTAIAALSDGTDFQARGEALRAVGAAMEEAIAQSISVTMPAAEGESPRIALAHAEIVRRQGGAVCTIPLTVAGETWGAITLERGGVAGFTRDEITFCEDLACFVGPVVRLKRQCEGGRFARLARSLGDWRERAVGRGHRVTKLALLFAAGGFAALVGVATPYRVSGPARLEGAIQRVLVAPSDGFLRQAHVRPGDLVRAEQVVAEFSDQDLQLERRKWESAAAQHENGYAAALARSDRSQLMILRAKADEARAQLGLVEQQLARMRLTAPFDGVIIKGDLRQSLGAPVQRGEALLTLAPAGEFRLIIEVDERDVGRIRHGDRGSLVLATMADRTWPFAIERVTPVAIVKDGRNAFEVEAKLDTASPAMQPGLEGVAKIEVGEATLAWIATHRLLDWLRITLWSWGL